MSIYSGETAGLMYGDQLRKEREANMLAADKALKQQQSTDYANQLKMHNEQVAANMAPVPKALAGAPQVQETPPKLTKEHGDLQTFLGNLAMGNPRAAEDSFDMIQKGSLWQKPDGSWGAKSKEGHDLNFAKEHVDAFRTGTRPRAADPNADLERERLGANIELTRKRTALLGSPKAETKIQKSSREARERKELKEIQDEVDYNGQDWSNTLADAKDDPKKESLAASKKTIWERSAQKLKLLQEKFKQDELDRNALTMTPPQAEVLKPDKVLSPLPPEPAYNPQPSGGGSMTRSTTMEPQDAALYQKIRTALSTGIAPDTNKPLSEQDRQWANQKLAQFATKYEGSRVEVAPQMGPPKPKTPSIGDAQRLVSQMSRDEADQLHTSGRMNSEQYNRYLRAEALAKAQQQQHKAEAKNLVNPKK